MRLTKFRASTTALVVLGVFGCDDAPAQPPAQASIGAGASKPTEPTNKPGQRSDIAAPSPSMTPLRD
jgi:hypothetical protein